MNDRPYTTVEVPLDEYLENIDDEDLEEAIMILSERYDSWQDFLSRPS